MGRTLPDDQPYGESWELSDRADCQSRVVSGRFAGRSIHDLWLAHRVEVFGEPMAGHPSPRFPLLVKVLDCADDLSIQVHPPAGLAAELGGEPKSEMWHFIEAAPGARLYAGLRRDVTREAFEDALAAGEVAGCVHSMMPAAGDSLMVHSGRLHALGRGLLVFEIQQNSDTTYRVFDWNRPGLDGRPRELHVEASLRSIDFDDFEPSLHPAGAPNPLAECGHFRVDRLDPGGDPQGRDGHARIIMPLANVDWGGVVVETGRVAIWPASDGPAPSVTGGAWLEIGLP